MFPDKSLPAHYHDFLECYYIISGKAMTWINDSFTEISAGDFYEIPASAVHFTKNIYSEPISIMWWFPLNNDFDNIAD